MPILRLYNTTDDAMEAVNELKQFKYGRVGIQLIAQSADDVGVDGLRQLGLPDAQARRFNDVVGNGGAVVSVEPPFGTGTKVIEILERSRSSDTGVSQAIETRPAGYGENSFGGEDDAAPLSAALGIPVLLNDPAPFSRWLRIPTLTRKQTYKSSSFGLPLLTDKAAPLSSALGLPVLSSDPAPFSTMLNLPVLSDDPAPFSSLLKLPVLSKDRAAPS